VEGPERAWAGARPGTDPASSGRGAGVARAPGSGGSGRDAGMASLRAPVTDIASRGCRTAPPQAGSPSAARTGTVTTRRSPWGE
ncbi:MAG: hypothetical protein ACK55I_24730, partial [bacterium]